MKKCYTCQETKDFIFFYKNRHGRYGFSNNCKACMKIFLAKYREKNKEKVQRWRRENDKKYREKNKEKIAKRNQVYYQVKDKFIKRKKIYSQEAKKRRKERRKEYTVENKEKLNEMHRKYYNARTKKDYMFKFKKKLQSSIKNAFTRKEWKKNSRTQEILGCNYETAFNHLKHTFEQNYKIPLHEAKEELHIDHIIPLSTAKTEDELIKLNYYTNLQYLYASDNLKKSDKLDWELSHETL